MECTNPSHSCLWHSLLIRWSFTSGSGRGALVSSRRGQPRSNRARPMRCSGRLKPNATRVRTRSLVLVGSIMALEMLLSSPAKIPGRFRRTRRASSANAGSRDGVALTHQRSNMRIVPASFAGDHRTELFFEQVDAVRAAADRGDPGSLAALRWVRSSRFFQRA